MVSSLTWVLNTTSFWSRWASGSQLWTVPRWSVGVHFIRTGSDGCSLPWADLQQRLDVRRVTCVESRGQGAALGALAGEDAMSATPPPHHKSLLKALIQDREVVPEN